MAFAGSRWTTAWIVVVLNAAVVAEFFELNMIFVALPSMYQEFGNPAAVGWALTAYALVGAASAAVGGRIGDVIGYRRVLIVVLFAGTVGSALSAVADSLWLLILGRALQGLTGVALPLAIGMMRRVVSEHRQKFMTGILASMYFVGGNAAAFISGQLVQHSGWRVIFWVSAGLTGVVAVLACTLPRAQERTGRLRDIDFVGGTLFAPGIALVLAGVTQVSSWGISNPATLGLIVGGLAVLGAWYRYERRHPSPIVDVRLFRNRVFAISCAGMFSYAAGAYGIGSTFPAFYMAPQGVGAGFGMSPSLFGGLGLIISPLTLVCVLVAGRMAQRRGAAFMVIGGASMNTLVFLALFVGIGFFGSHSLVLAIIPFAFFAASQVFVNAGLPTFVIESIPKDRTGEAVGVQQVVNQGGQALGIQIAAVLIGLQLVADPAGGAGVYPAVSSVLIVLGYGIVLCLVVVAVTLLARAKARRGEVVPAEALDALPGGTPGDSAAGGAGRPEPVPGQA